MTPLQERKFAHEPVYCQQRGRVKVYCRCGRFQSPRHDDFEGAQDAYKKHVGIRERELKPSLLMQLKEHFA